MKVTVARDGTLLGAWERHNIQAAIVDGTLRLDDDYFTTGMRTWLKLSALTDALPPAGRIDSRDTTTGASHWKRAAVNFGWMLVSFAGAGALLNPSYVTQALVATAGVMVIMAARTLR